MIRVTLPSQLLLLTSGQRHVQVEANNLIEVFEKLHEKFPMIGSQIFDNTGKLRQFVGIFVNDRQVGPDEISNKLVPIGSHVFVLFSVAGG